MGKVIITHEFDSHEEADDIKRCLTHEQAYSVLWDVDQELRTLLKHCDEEWIRDDKASERLEKLRELIWESGVLNDYR